MSLKLYSAPMIRRKSSSDVDGLGLGDDGRHVNALEGHAARSERADLSKGTANLACEYFVPNWLSAPILIGNSVLT